MEGKKSLLRVVWTPSRRPGSINRTSGLSTCQKCLTCIPWATGGWRIGWSCTCCSKRPTLDVYMYIGGSSNVPASGPHFSACIVGRRGSAAPKLSTRPHLTCRGCRSATLCRFFIEKEEVQYTDVLNNTALKKLTL